jgi:DNA-directed RNA polymerase-3 subunit RPC5
VRIKTGNPAHDSLRLLVVDNLRDKDSFKRSEIFDQAATRKIVMTDSLYNKIVKELCTSKGNQWFLRTGAEM